MVERRTLYRIRDNICSFKMFFFHLLALQVAILFVLLFSFAVLEPGGSADYLLLMVDLALLAATLAGTFGMIYVCRDH